MNIKNKEKIAEIIDSVIREENDAREKELQAAKEKIRGLEGSIALQKKELSSFYITKSHLIRLQELTQHYYCPQCDGEGGRDDGQGGGGECEICSGCGFVNKLIVDERKIKHAPQVLGSSPVVSAQDDEILPF